jgi:hypothetical protein
MIKAASHVHSEWSYDGKWALPALADAFARRGYRALLVTDHDRGFTEQRYRQHRMACEAASSDRILVVPGIEYSDAANRVHVLVWGDVPFLGESLATSIVLARAKSAGGLSVLAHPARREAWRLFDPDWTDTLLGIEIWNRKTDGWAPSRSGRRLLDGSGVAPFVGMDFHDWKQMFPLSMDLEIDGSVTEAGVLACLRAGAFRAAFAGTPVERFVEGHLSTPFYAAERLRRSAAVAYRALQSR